ncbi:MAG: BrnT family toxin [Ignavibacteriota bacterium]
MRFEWDSRKEALNRAKHGVSFDEASTIFDNFEALIFDDPKHSIAERREIIVGTSAAERILIASFTARNENIRIIKCTKSK